MENKNTIIEWIDERRVASKLQVNSIDLDKTDSWKLCDEHMIHETDRYFSIIAIQSDSNDIKPNSQPIILQSEIGILGYVFRETLKGAEILLQAKTEPGNVRGTQISPSVQATYSNYMQVHKGEPTKYLDVFLKNNELVDEGTLQSEQGTRFLSKYNRNISVFINANEIEEPKDKNWKWVTVIDLFKLMDQDFLINTDARSVLVCSDWNKLAPNFAFEKLPNENSFRSKLRDSFELESNIENNSCNHHIAKLNLSRKKREFTIEKIPFNELDGWDINKKTISKEGVFSIKSFDINVVGREVSKWSQPLIHSQYEGKVVLYCQSINGILHFLCSHSLEIGFLEYIQFGPSIQLLHKGDQIHSTLDIAESNSKLISKYKQSDEGGRFYKSIVHYQLKEILLDDPIAVDLNTYSWMTLKQIKYLLGTKGNFTNEFRSVLSLILKFL